MKPKISIIVPVYNIELYLERCVESILSQTFVDFELILVNDGSTDQSGKVCDYYSEKDQRVKVLHKNNGGLSFARNEGLKIACGDFIGFVDGDDYIEKDMYKKLYELSEKTNSDIAICKFGREINGQLINELQQEFSKEMDNIEAMRQLFKGELYRFSVCNKLFRKSCFENILFPEGRIHEDLSTSYKLFANSTKSVYTNYVGYIYVKRENSILNSRFNEKRLDAFLGWDEILSFMGQKYPKLTKEVISCFAYGCVDNVHYIVNQVESKDSRIQYLSIIKRLHRKFYSKILLNNTLSLKDKFILSLLNCNCKMLIFLIKSKKKLVKKRVYAQQEEV